MSVTEAALLVLGIVFFVISFVIPERKRALKEEDRRLGEEQIRELVEKQMQEAKERVSDMVDETITYAVEKTERSMERLSNEKIMAMNEYSDTVLETIHKSHEEAVFLYDMLSDKQENLKETMNQAQLRAKEAQAEKKEQETAKPALPEKEPPAKGRGAKAKKPQKKEAFIPLTPAAVSERAVNEKIAADLNAEDSDKKTPEITLSFAQTGDDGKNNNEKILALHREGKSNMGIARELGLGIGEVKLVIDLYKGM